MFDVYLEINGERVDPDKIGNAMDAMIFQGVVEKAREFVRSKLTSEEQTKITIRFVGTSTSDLQMKLNGPEEILAKIKSALKQ